MGYSAPECTFGGLQASQGNNNNKIVAKRLPNKTKHLLPKLLYAFIPFLLSFFTLGTLRSNDADGNESVKKTIGLISKTTTLHVHHAFFVHFSSRFFCYQISSFTLLTTMNSEMRQCQSFFISCTGQCPVFCNNNLRTPDGFGTFSRCSDDVSR